MEGPAFSTRAESHWYRSMGAHVIGMTNLQEAKLAREAEMAYATVALATDYDCWHETEEDVNVADVVAVLKANVERAKKVVAAAAERIAGLAEPISASRRDGARDHDGSDAISPRRASDCSRSSAVTSDGRPEPSTRSTRPDRAASPRGMVARMSLVSRRGLLRSGLIGRARRLRRARTLACTVPRVREGVAAPRARSPSRRRTDSPRSRSPVRRCPRACRRSTPRCSGSSRSRTTRGRHSVGYGGLPNEDGVVELDSCVMDGRPGSPVPSRVCATSRTRRRSR
jgi:hypothetical protein